MPVLSRRSSRGKVPPRRFPGSGPGNISCSPEKNGSDEPDDGIGIADVKLRHRSLHPLVRGHGDQPRRRRIDQGFPGGFPVDLDLGEPGGLVPLRKDDVHPLDEPRKDRLEGDLFPVMQDDRRLFPGGDHRDIRPRGGEPVTVLPGVVDLEAVRVVLDGGHPMPGRFQTRDDLLREGRLSRVLPPDEAQDGGAQNFTTHFAPPGSIRLSLCSHIALQPVFCGTMPSPDSPSYRRTTRSRPPGRACRCSDRKSTRLNSSHGYISYSVFFFKKNSSPEPRTHPTSFLTLAPAPDA